MERSAALPITLFAYLNGLGTCDALSCMSHALQSALESGHEARIVHTYFSAAFDRVNRQGILYRLCSVGIEGSLFFVFTQFLSNRLWHVMVDGCRSKLVNVVTAVPQGCLLLPLIVSPVHF